MTHSLDRRIFLATGMSAFSLGVAASQSIPGLAQAAQTGARNDGPIPRDDPRLPDPLSVDYSCLHYEVVNYQNYNLDSMPRIRFRGPRFDPRNAEKGQFFSTLGPAHTLGVMSPVTYTQILAQAIGIQGWNVGVGGISAFFYNSHPEIIEYANRGKFAIVQVTTARLASNDRIQSTPAAQTVLDRRHGDMVSPELAWARIEKEEPDNLETYIAQSRASWERDYRQLLSALTVPTVLLWFGVRSMEVHGEAIRQVGSTSVTAFPQLIDGTDVRKIQGLADAMAVCVTSRNSGYPLVSRFTGKPVSVKYPAVNLVEDVNTYYPSPEMHEDAAHCLLPVVQKLSDPTCP